MASTKRAYALTLHVFTAIGKQMSSKSPLTVTVIPYTVVGWRRLLEVT